MRRPALTVGQPCGKKVLQAARKTIDDPVYAVETASAWGWKQPNVQVMVPLIAPYLSGMKYIYVVRNGLDMAFGYNQNQLKYFWGDLLLGSDAEATPANALRYWVASYKRNLCLPCVAGRQALYTELRPTMREPASRTAETE